MGKALLVYSEDDLIDLIDKLKHSGIQPVTVEGYKIILRGYYKFNERLELLKVLKINNKVYHGNRKLPTEMIVEDEVKRLMSAENSLMYQALIMSLWESGARIGEFLPLKIKDVYFDNDGCFFIMPEGKTGMRRVRLVNSTSLLSNWMEYHPLKCDKLAPLWLSYKCKRLGYWGLCKHLRVLFKQCGISKPCNPHNFRHSRATFMAGFLKEAQMKEYFGWTQDSGMASRYVHLSGRDVDNAVLGVYNLGSHRELTSQLQPIKCFNCKRQNEAGRTRCAYCGLPLDFNGLREQLKKDLLIDELIKDKDKILEMK